MALTSRDRDLLNFEERNRGDSGTKTVAIRDTFGLTRARYYQILNGLLDEPDAVAEFPMLVRALRDARERRVAERVRRTLR